MEIIAVPAIVSLVFGIVELYKKAVEKHQKKEDFLRLIPVLSTALGLIAGLVCYFAIPGIILADSVISALIIGGASGLSATGCNQIFKQLHKYGIHIKKEEDTSESDTENKDDSNSN